MPDTTHELSILARARDEVSGPFRNMGAAGKRAMEEVSRGTRTASEEFARLNGGIGRVSVSARDMGASVKRGLAGVAAGIAAGSQAAQGFQKNLVGIGASLASALAAGGPAGLAIAGIGLGIGLLASKASEANDRMVEMTKNLERAARVRMQGVVSIFDSATDARQVLRATSEGRDPAMVKRLDDLQSRIFQAEQEAANAKANEAKYRRSLDAYQPRTYPERVKDFYASGIDIADEPKKKILEKELDDARKARATAEAAAKSLSEERDAIRATAALGVTKELEKQLRLVLAQTDAQRLQVQLDEQRKDVIAKSEGDPRALALFDELANRMKQRQGRADEDAFRARMDPISASTAGLRAGARRDAALFGAGGDPAKVAAAAQEFERSAQLLEKDRLREQLAKEIRDANGDTTKEQQAQAIYSANLANLAERTRSAEQERQRSAKDMVRTMEEQARILADQTGLVEKQIRRQHELEDAARNAAGSGMEAQAVEAQKLLQRAQDEAERRGTQGQYLGDHMDKGLATARARRRKALHEEKFRSGGWAGSGGIHDTFDMFGNAIYQDAPGGGIPNRGDFTGLYGPQNTRGPGSRAGGGGAPPAPGDVTRDGVSYVYRAGTESADDVLQKLLRANYGDKGPPAAGGGGDVAGAAGKLADSAGAGAESSKAAAASLEGAKTSLDAAKGATDEVGTHASAIDQAGQEMAAKQGEIASMLANLTQTQRDWIANANRTIEEIKRFIDGFGTTLGGP